MPLSAASSSQVPCSLDLSTPNPLPHTPVRHPSSHDTPFCHDFVRQIRENRQRVQGVRGEEQSLLGGSDKKGEVGRTFLVPLIVLFFRTPPKAIFFSLDTPNPLRILLHLADVLPSQYFALLPPQSISSAGCPTIRSGLSLST